MKSPSIESFYANLNKQIRLAQSYTEIDSLSSIIRACRLKPTEYLSNRSKNIILYRHWEDEFNNSLSIKKKKLIITTGNLINKKPIVCTDMYHGLSIAKISKMSKLLFLSFGKDEDKKEDCCLLTFLGIDNYLRSYLLLYGEWRQVSPLIIGVPNLKNIFKKIDIKYFIKLSKKENCVIPCVSTQTWITCMPASPDFIDLIRKECSYILPILREDN